MTHIRNYDQSEYKGEKADEANEINQNEPERKRK